jgi:hypothetical protein
MLLPDAALPLLFVGGCLALMFGLIRGRALFGILGLLLVLPVLGPVTEAVMQQLPPWLSLVILAFFCLAILRGLAALVLGQRAADTMVGNLAADLVRLVVTILILPLRIVRAAFRVLLNENGPR